MDQFHRFFSHLWVKLVLLVLVLIILFFLVRRLLVGPSRSRGRRNNVKVYSSNYRGRRR